MMVFPDMVITVISNPENMWQSPLFTMLKQLHPFRGMLLGPHSEVRSSITRLKLVLQCSVWEKSRLEVRGPS